MGGTDRKLLLDVLHQVLVLAEMSDQPKTRITYIIIVQGQIYILFRAPGRPSDWETRRQNGNSRQNLARMLPGLEL